VVSCGLNDFFSIDRDNACAWAVNVARVETDQDARVWAGFDDRGEVWINGKRLPLRNSQYADEWLADSRTSSVRLRAGRNTVAIRTCEDTGDWRFYFRMAAPEGRALTGIRWEYGNKGPTLEEQTAEPG
jgi:hypothetical protein